MVQLRLTGAKPGCLHLLFNSHTQAFPPDRAYVKRPTVVSARIWAGVRHDGHIGAPFRRHLNASPRSCGKSARISCPVLVADNLPSQNGRSESGFGSARMRRLFSAFGVNVGEYIVLLVTRGTNAYRITFRAFSSSAPNVRGLIASR